MVSHSTHVLVSLTKSHCWSDSKLQYQCNETRTNMYRPNNRGSYVGPFPVYSSHKSIVFKPHATQVIMFVTLPYIRPMVHYQVQFARDP